MIEYRIYMEAKCDGCGTVLALKETSKPADIAPIRWEWQHQWKKRGVMLRERKYRKPLIYCEACADGNPDIAREALAPQGTETH